MPDPAATAASCVAKHRDLDDLEELQRLLTVELLRSRKKKAADKRAAPLFQKIKAGLEAGMTLKARSCLLVPAGTLLREADREKLVLDEVYVQDRGTKNRTGSALLLRKDRAGLTKVFCKEIKLFTTARSGELDQGILMSTAHSIRSSMIMSQKHPHKWSKPLGVFKGCEPLTVLLCYENIEGSYDLADVLLKSRSQHVPIPPVLQKKIFHDVLWTTAELLKEDIFERDFKLGQFRVALRQRFGRRSFSLVLVDHDGHLPGGETGEAVLAVDDFERGQAGLSSFETASATSYAGFISSAAAVLSSAGLSGLELLGIELGLHDRLTALEVYEKTLACRKVAVQADLVELHSLASKCAVSSHTGVAEHSVASALVKAKEILDTDENSNSVDSLMVSFVESLMAEEDEDEDDDEEQDETSEEESPGAKDHVWKAPEDYPMVVSAQSHVREDLLRIELGSGCGGVVALHVTTEDEPPRKKAKTRSGALHVTTEDLTCLDEGAPPPRRPAKNPDVLLVEDRNGQVSWPLLQNESYIKAIGKRAGFDLHGKLLTAANHTSLQNWMPHRFRAAKEKKMGFALPDVDECTRQMVKTWASEWVRPGCLGWVYTGAVFCDR